ncbi:hypothetical protein [Polaromonas sp.]|uniref:hypothetical protein n=1 Tax=Polaromonas sp. TaxID=1869339 RepID=UPI00183DD471|nr:hypothetical protein [Polaromonas sp.]NMM05968.1 hypothetical protein [Polaromonas sp.]
MSANSATSSSSSRAHSALPHLLIPFAACSAPAWLPTMQALPRDSTRNLSRLLQGMKPIRTDEGDAHTLSPPHERALARAQGLLGDAGVDGLIPWAASDAAKHLQADGQLAWAWITPCHWAMGRGHATLSDPAALALREDESRALLTAMQPYFESDGITLHDVDAPGPQRWLAEGELFRSLPTASLDRVLGRNVDAWLPGAKSVGAKKITLLQNEMQMLLYTHPLNDERAARRELPVNSIWISGTGALPTDYAPAAKANINVTRSLAQAVFADDWDAYAQAWAQLDGGAVAQLLARQQAGEAVRLTLCGERSAQTFASSQAGLFARISSLLAPKPIWDGLQQL